MKTQALIMILLLLCTAIFASEDSSNAAEYERKTQELNQLAERFKAETGFVGDIGYSHQSMSFNNYRGYFRDIPITAPQDTVAMKHVFEQVFSRVEPYIKGREGQFVREKMGVGVIGTWVTYRQRVNGYRIESGGVLNIDYNIPTSEIIVTDNTVDISNELVQINITEDQAIDAVLHHYEPRENFDKNHWMFRRHVRLVYAPIEYESGAVEFKLCYLIPSVGGTRYVDPTTGEIIYTRFILKANDDCYVTGDIYESAYTGSNILQIPNSTLSNIKVITDNFVGYTDTSGFIAITDSICSNLTIELDYDLKLSQCEYPDVSQIVKADSSNILITGDTIRAHFPDNLYNSTNIYYHTLDQFIKLNSISSVSNSFGWNIISNSPTNDLGYCDPSTWEIHIRRDVGQYSHVTRHELSHAFIYDKLNGAFFHNTDQSKRAMDEAFAVYLPCSVINSNLYINSPNSVNDIAHYSVSDVLINYSQEYPNYVLNEDFYQEYFCRYPISSAWWEIRNSIGANTFDLTLINAVRTIADTRLDSLRYKPRYFYNTLMRNSAPSNQIAIDKAYTSRGLHFTPQVESYSAANKLRNVFAPGDKVHLNISKAPQNTPFTVYVIRHDDYTYVDDANVSTLLPHLANGFSHPITGNHTDAQGMWNGLIWTIPTGLANMDGGYDIIVDFGSPDAPDNKIHFTYTAANVMDGFDGLHEPGFTVYDDGSTFVVTGSRPSSSPGNK